MQAACTSILENPDLDVVTTLRFFRTIYMKKQPSLKMEELDFQYLCHQMLKSRNKIVGVWILREVN